LRHVPERQASSPDDVPLASPLKLPGETSPAMSTDFSGLIEMSLVFGIVLVLAIAELISLRRTQRRDDEPARQDRADSTSREANHNQ